jgi:hypothetical protein
MMRFLSSMSSEVCFQGVLLNKTPTAVILWANMLPIAYMCPEVSLAIGFSIENLLLLRTCELGEG